MNRVIEIVIQLLVGSVLGLWTTWLLRNSALYHHIHGRHRPTANFPAFLPILMEMSRAWERITDDDIDRCNLRFSAVEKGDTTLGVAGPDARKTCALAAYFCTQRDQAQLLASGQAKSMEEINFHLEQSRRFDTLSKCADALFWAQVKDDAGRKAWETRMLGMRAGWLLVAPKTPGPEAFIDMLRGNLPGGST